MATLPNLDKTVTKDPVPPITDTVLTPIIIPPVGTVSLTTLVMNKEIDNINEIIDYISGDNVAGKIPANALTGTKVQFDTALSDGDFIFVGDAPTSHTHLKADITDTPWLFSEIQNIATSRILGRVTAATGVIEELTGTQATTLIDTFTSALKGLAPSSGGGTVNFLRADGTWVDPSGGGGFTIAGTGLTSSGVTVNAIGTASRISVGADNIDIDSGYVGQASITTVGTIGTGIWEGTAVATGFIATTLTGKTLTTATINADSNTITNIGSTEIKSEIITGQATVTGISGDFVLISDTSDTGNLKKVDVLDFLGGGEVFSWTADHSTNGNSLILTDDATPPAGTVAAIYLETGELNFNVADTNLQQWRVNDAIEMSLSATVLNLQGNTLTNLIDITTITSLNGVAIGSYVIGTDNISAISASSTTQFNTALTGDSFFFVSQNISNMATSTSAEFDTANSDGTFFLNADNIADMGTSTSAEFDAANSDGTFFLNADNISAMAASTVAQFNTALTGETFVFIGVANVWGTANQNIAATGVWQEGGTAISPIGTHTQWIPAGAWGSVTTNGATFAELELPTNDIMLQTFDFNQTTSQKIQFWWEAPAEWDAGTITFNAKWTAGAGAGTVIWTLSGHSYSDAVAIDVAIGGTPASTGADTLSAVNENQITAESGAVTLDGATKGEAVLLQIVRDISDTLTADAKLLGINITYTTDEATAT